MGHATAHSRVPSWVGQPKRNGRASAGEAEAVKRDGTRTARPRHELRVSFSVLFKIAVAALLILVAIKLWQPFLWFLVAVLLALTLDPLVQWFERRGASRALAVIAVSVLMIGVFAAIVFLLIPPLVSQMGVVIDDYNATRERIEQDFPGDWPVMKKLVTQVLALPEAPEVKAWIERPLVWGELTVAITSVTIVVLTLALYLLADGKRLYAFLVSYVPRRHRAKFAQTVPGVTEVVRAYVRGQVLTSVFCGVAVLIVMESLGVPAAVPLAVLAAVLNIIPVLGSIVMAVPAVLLALTVSPVTAGAVIVFYIAYQLLENYVIVPWVYGRTLRLSTLAVLLALLVGGLLEGMLGAFLVLPLVAAYPIVERIWLRRYLGTETVTDHKALAASVSTRQDQHTVEKVLRGDEAPHAAGPIEPPTPVAKT
jgi:predicted PurR-regulated permease PerM